MAVIEIAKIQVRRGQENVTGVPQLDPGEFGWAQDTQHLYIGKRISEGANNDENSRILTDLDLRSILDIIGVGTSGSVASTSTYRYRDTLDFNHFKSTSTTIAKKLDTTLYLSDFSQTNIEGTDITSLLKTAIKDIYANDYYGTDTVRTLKIPAGHYTISGIVDLPPFVTMIGEGVGVTTLVLNSAGTGMFRTVDKLGAHFGESMQFDERASKEVTIANMTLAYSGQYQNNEPLLSLDNTEHPKISNVEFTTINTTTGFVSAGLGIQVRGDLGTDESTVICKDIEISNCKFTVLDTAIEEVGEVSKTIIEKNIFANLNNGINVITTATSTPVDVHVHKNKFTFVYNEAINVSTSSNSSRVISSENAYYYVGNRSSEPDQLVATARVPVLTFNAPGNVSLNDYFHRTDVSSEPGFYFNPIANANLKIVNNKTYKSMSLANSQNVSMINIPITGQEQLVVVEYQLSNIEMSRKGRLTINIAADGFASVSDYYNFSEVNTDASTKIIFSTSDANSISNNYISLTCSNFSSNDTSFEYTLDITV